MAPRLEPHYEEMVTLSKAGMSRKAIAEKIGCSPSVVSQIAIRNGAPKRYVRTEGCDPHREAIVDLVARGYAFSMVARKLGVSYETLRTWASVNKVRAIPHRYHSLVLSKSLLERLKEVTGRPSRHGAIKQAIAEHFGLDLTGIYPTTFRRPDKVEVERILNEAASEGNETDYIANRYGVNLFTVQGWFDAAGLPCKRNHAPKGYDRVNLDFHGPFYAEMERRAPPEFPLVTTLITILRAAACSERAA